ncbi:hypothetical protein SAMN05428965_1494 [Geodermatophilus sp. DSM 45219]|nr:hypothetical protein SAMN05428965_1494 [Geodermatophilus sp. DSM 45219]
MELPTGATGLVRVDGRRDLRMRPDVVAGAVLRLADRAAGDPRPGSAVGGAT